MKRIWQLIRGSCKETISSKLEGKKRGLSCPLTLTFWKVLPDFSAMPWKHDVFFSFGLSDIPEMHSNYSVFEDNTELQ